MRVLISGATGMVGTALGGLLKAQGHEVTRLVRAGKATGTDVVWDPQAGNLDSTRLEGFDAVVHLAGENIAGGRWTEKRKERILQSRAKGTRVLAEALARLQRPPKVLVSASAIGYYGDRGTEILSEASASGSGFLADVCKAWESATQPAAAKGIRVACIRIGLVLSVQGGALAKMLPPFRMGVGGKLGSGTQYMSWISLTDLCRVIVHVIETDSMSGAVNAVSPAPVTNAEFTKALGAGLHRPVIFPLPAFAARIMFGEMADALLLSSTRVVPVRLEGSGFVFDHPEIKRALEHVLNARI